VARLLKGRLDQHVAEDAQWFGGALVVEPRFIADLVLGMIAEGLTVRRREGRWRLWERRVSARLSM
jgi:hypothetical protein